jgi:hypothetical protein
MSLQVYTRKNVFKKTELLDEYEDGQHDSSIQIGEE